MDFLLTQILAAISAMSPIGAFGWLLTCLLSTYVVKELRGESITEKELRNKMQDLQNLHNQALSASHDARVQDLKELSAKYDLTVKSIISALKKLEK